MINWVFILVIIEYITMALPPGGIVDFNHNGFNPRIRSIVAVIKTSRIKAISKIPQVGQQSNRPGRSFPKVRLNKISNSSINGHRRIAKMIFAVKISNVPSLV